MSQVVAITGATGFVGSALARALAGAGAQIIALSRPGSDRSRLQGLDVSWREADVGEAGSLDAALAGAEWLVHAAGMLGQAGVPEAAYHRLHVQGTRNVLQAARHVKRVLYVSSPGVLGPIAGAPAAETAPLAPSNPYERSKAAAETVALEFAAAGLPVVIARPEFIYGPGDRHVLGLFQAVQRGLFFYVGDGHNTCHPTYVDDAVDGMIRCLRRGSAGQIYHLAGPRPVTFRELGETIAAALGVRAPWLRLPLPLARLAAAGLEAAGRVTPWEPPLTRSGVAFFSEDRRFTWEKAAEALGYSARVDLETGVARTVAWYRAHGLL